MRLKEHGTIYLHRWAKQTSDKSDFNAPRIDLEFESNSRPVRQFSQEKKLPLN